MPIPFTTLIHIGAKHKHLSISSMHSESSSFFLLSSSSPLLTFRRSNTERQAAGRELSKCFSISRSSGMLSTASLKFLYQR